MSAGSYFEAQFEAGTLDPWAVIGIAPEDTAFDAASIKTFIKRVVTPHVFERDPNVPHGVTFGPRVPCWRHVNSVRSRFEDDDEVAGARLQWKDVSMQTWNPHARPGSAAAKVPRSATVVVEEEEQRQQQQPTASSSRPAGRGKRKRPGVVIIDSSSDDERGGSADRRPDGPSPRKRQRTAGSRPSSPFVVPDEDENAGPPRGGTAWDDAYTVSSSDDDDDDDDDNDDDDDDNNDDSIIIDEAGEDEHVHETAGSADVNEQLTESTPAAGPAQATGAAAAAAGTAGSTTTPTTPLMPSHVRNPPSGNRRRYTPKGVYLGSWNRSGLHAMESNAVYGSSDGRGRVNRRISKEDNNGRVVVGGNYDSKRTACSHGDINYAGRFAGQSKEAIDRMIKGVEQDRSLAAPETASTAAIVLPPWVDLTGDE